MPDDKAPDELAEMRAEWKCFKQVLLFLVFPILVIGAGAIIYVVVDAVTGA